jgi:hypothetical protein
MRLQTAWEAWNFGTTEKHETSFSRELDHSGLYAPTTLRPTALSELQTTMIGQSTMPSPAPERQSLVSFVPSAVPAHCYANVHGKIICNTTVPSSIPSLLPSLSPNAGGMSPDQNMMELSSTNSIESTLFLGVSIIVILATAMFCIFANKIRYDPSEN